MGILTEPGDKMATSTPGLLLLQYCGGSAKSMRLDLTPDC